MRLKLAALAAAAVLLCAGCGAGRAGAETGPLCQDAASLQQAAARAADQLGRPGQAQALTAGQICRLLGLKQGDLRAAAGCMVLEDGAPQQVLVLCPRPGAAPRAQRALEDRLELVRQTCAAWLAEESGPARCGEVFWAGGCVCLTAAGGSGTEDCLAQAREVLTRALGG